MRVLWSVSKVIKWRVVQADVAVPLMMAFAVKEVHIWIASSNWSWNHLLGHYKSICVHIHAQCIRLWSYMSTRMFCLIAAHCSTTECQTRWVGTGCTFCLNEALLKTRCFHEVVNVANTNLRWNDNAPTERRKKGRSYLESHRLEMTERSTLAMSCFFGSSLLWLTVYGNRMLVASQWLCKWEANNFLIYMQKAAT